MVDVNGIGQTATQAFASGATYTTIFLIIIGFIALLLWTRYVRSFNHEVIIKRPTPNGGFELDRGYRGRFIWKSIKNEGNKRLVFEIFQARKKKINYNQESDCYDKRIPCLVNGRRKYLVIMEPDSEGFLHPVVLNDRTDHSMEAVLSQADIAFYEAELQNLAAKYDVPDFMAKYGLVIYIVLVLIIAALYWWGTKNMAAGMDTIATALNANTAATAEMSRLTTSIINGSIKSTLAPITVIP